MPALPPSVGRISVLVADDDEPLRDALCDLIILEDGLELVGSAADADGAVELASAHTPDVAIVDVRMPGGGTTACRQIRISSPQTRVVAYSAYEDRKTVLEMLRAGASGFLVKGTSAAEILDGIRRAARGQSALSAEVTGQVVGELSARLDRAEVQAAQERDRVQRIRAALEGQVIRMVFQPIRDLRSRRTVGLEALARFQANPPRPPDAWFAEARAVGMGIELEVEAVRRAIEEIDRLPLGAYLSVNLSPETAVSPVLSDVLAGTPSDRIVLEITEHAPVHDYESLQEALTDFRAWGGRLAVDDVGSGFASLRHILRLNPDMLKLDIALTRGIDADPARRALARALISFAGEIDAEMVAEGIETRSEIETLRELGVALGQGYHLGRPEPLRTALLVAGADVPA